MAHSMFQSLCTELFATAVVHHKIFFHTGAALKHPMAATVTANRTMNVQKSYNMDL